MTQKAVPDTFLNIEPIDLVACGLTNADLQGEVAVVTGGASNIGLGYARAIAAAGGSVVVSDINAKAGKEAERVINLENGRDAALFVQCDITSEDDVKALAKAAFDRFGKVDILVNNAMNMRLNGTILESTVEDLDASYAISGRGVMLAIKEFVPPMLARGHGTVTYSTTQFHYLPPMLGRSIYTAGKAAATSLVMSLANEVKGSGVNVFCMVPAGVGRIDDNHQAPVSDDGGTPLPDLSNFSMPGFNGLVPPEVSGAAMVYLLMNASHLHGSGFILQEALQAMKFPFPNPSTLPPPSNVHKMNDMELTLAFCNMGAGPSAIG